MLEILSMCYKEHLCSPDVQKFFYVFWGPVVFITCWGSEDFGCVTIKFCLIPPLRLWSIFLIPLIASQFSSPPFILCLRRLLPTPFSLKTVWSPQSFTSLPKAKNNYWSLMVVSCPLIYQSLLVAVLRLLIGLSPDRSITWQEWQMKMGRL